MKLNSIEKKEKSTVQMVVEVGAEKFAKAVDSAYKKNKGSIMIPGFRKGKAPKTIIEKMYGESIFYDDAINILYPDAFDFAVEEEKLKVVGQPSVSDVDVSDDKVLTITFLTAVYPEVVLGQYKGLSAEYEVSPVTEEDVNKEVEALRSRNARIVSVDRPAKDGDTAVIDFKGYLDGELFDGGSAENHSLVLGSGSFIPGFEEQLVGVTAGEEKDVNVTFPEDYHEELKGKDAVFKVKVLELKENILPELDDEFAKDVSEFDTLEEYIKSVREKLAEEREKAAEESFKNAIMDKAVENMEADVPDALVEAQIDHIVQDFYYNVSAQGMNPEEYLGMMGLTIESFRASCRANAEKSVNYELLVSKIAETEEVEVSEEDLNAEYKKLAEMYGMEEEQIRAAVTDENVSNDIKMNKAASIVYESGVKEKPETKEKPAEEDKPKKAKKTEEDKPKKTKKAEEEDKPKKVKKTEEADKPKKTKKTEKAEKEEEAE